MAPVSLTPVVYLRGAGSDQRTWDWVTETMHDRGWATTRTRTAAFHLARGGAPVVFCDFSTDLYDKVRVGLVRAKYETVRSTVPVASLLPTDVVVAMRRAERDDVDWLDNMVEVDQTEMTLPLTNGGVYPRPTRKGHLDWDMLAALVGGVLSGERSLNTH